MAVVGLGAAGLFHLERLGLQPNVRLTAAFDPNRRKQELAEPFVERLVDSWEQLLLQQDVDVVWLAVPVSLRSRMAEEALTAGKHVVVEQPVGVCGAELLRLQQTVESSRGVTLNVLPLREPDHDFTSAVQLIRENRLGRLRQILYVQWGFSESCEQSKTVLLGSPPFQVNVSAALLKKTTAALDQLLKLVDEPVSRLVACSGEGSEFPSNNLSNNTSPADVTNGSRSEQASGTTRWCSPSPNYSFQKASANNGAASPGSVKNLTLTVHFQSGLCARVDLSVSSFTELSTGWVLQGEQAAYKAGRLYQITEEGEIFSLPVEAEPVLWENIYKRLFDHLRAGENNTSEKNTTTRDFEHALELVRIFDALSESLCRAAVVTLERTG